MTAPVAPCPVHPVVRVETHHDETSRNVGADVVRRRRPSERADRFFRDIHGIESVGSHAFVLGRVRRQSATDDDVSWRYWTVVCADRGGTRAR